MLVVGIGQTGATGFTGMPGMPGPSGHSGPMGAPGKHSDVTGYMLFVNTEQKRVEV